MGKSFTLADFNKPQSVTFPKFDQMGRGGGLGLVVSVLAFYSSDLSSNPTEIYSFLKWVIHGHLVYFLYFQPIYDTKIVVFSLFFFFYLLWKNGPTPASFSFIFGLFKQTLQFLQQIYVKNVHPVYSAGIWTHDLWNVGLLP